MSIRLISTI